MNFVEDILIPSKHLPLEKFDSHALVLLSGGMDSTTALYRARFECSGQVKALSITYGSKHNLYENDAAQRICTVLGVELLRLDIRELMASCAIKSNLLKTGGDIPEGHYAAENMKQTVVPGRNGLFIQLAASILESDFGSGLVYIGAHAGDHHIYPDCRPEFINYMGMAIWHGSDHRVGLRTPYLRGSKESILREGYHDRFRVPYELTRTCYKDQPIACGKCGSCQERLEAFLEIGFVDPLDYEYREITT